VGPADSKELKMKCFVLKAEDINGKIWYWFEGDEGDGQYWVSNIEDATVMSERHTMGYGDVSDWWKYNDRDDIYANDNGKDSRTTFKDVPPVFENIKEIKP